MTGVLLKLAGIAFVAYLLVIAAGRAVDLEHARAGMTGQGLSERASGTGLLPAKGTGLASQVDRDQGYPAARSESLYQGKPIRWWARRAVQNKKDSLARGRTIRRLKRELRASGPSWGWLADADCVHGKEGAWDDPNAPYWGGMQADMDFQRAYGRPYLERWGTADNWPVWAQLHMAYNGWVARGWQPWPNTARECGLR